MSHRRARRLDRRRPAPTAATGSTTHDLGADGGDLAGRSRARGSSGSAARRPRRGRARRGRRRRSSGRCRRAARPGRRADAEAGKAAAHSSDLVAQLAVGGRSPAADRARRCLGAWSSIRWARFTALVPLRERRDVVLRSSEMTPASEDQQQQRGASVSVVAGRIGVEATRATHRDRGRWSHACARSSESDRRRAPSRRAPDARPGRRRRARARRPPSGGRAQREHAVAVDDEYRRRRGGRRRTT